MIPCSFACDACVAHTQDMLEQLARYYDLPSVSLRDVIWHAMKANTTFGGLRLHQLYYDRIHPSNYGHSILAHGLIHLLRRANLMLEIDGLPPTRDPLLTARDAGPHAAAAGASCLDNQSSRQLPPPMLPNVAGASHRRLECHDAASMAKLVQRASCAGWEHVVERSPSGVPKPGWVATKPGASCTFAYAVAGGSKGGEPARAADAGWASDGGPELSSAANAPAAAGSAGGGPSSNRIGIGYLKSYEHMGVVRVDCVDACQCSPVEIDAHTAERISPLDLIYFSAQLRPPQPTGQRDASALISTRANELTDGASGLSAPAPAHCGIRLTLLNKTSSGEHKFKLTALFLNKHSDLSYFGRWIYGQASEARGAVAVAEQAEKRIKLAGARQHTRAARRRGRGGIVGRRQRGATGLGRGRLGAVGQ